MRNLRIVDFEEICLASENDVLPLTATAWDSGFDSVVCAFGPTPSKPIIELKRKAQQTSSQQNDVRDSKKYVSITSWDAPCPLPDLDCDQILLMQHFADTATTCLVLAGGDLILVREDPQPDQEKIEIVGSIDVGISAASWSPDEELLAAVTRAGVVLLMSRDLEPIKETTFSTEDLQLSKHVSVGWGKKETQFQGKRAKALRDPTMPESVDEGKPSSFEDKSVNISWRGDGAFLAINSSMSSPRRVIRVFSREGVLDSVSEPVDGLESALSWRPYGNLIASIRRTENSDSESKLEVIFFERNGLRHGQFDLRLSPAEMSSFGKHISLAWNIDSSVLAVKFSDRVQFWTMGNYHHYLKQELRMSDVTAFKWHLEKALRCTLCNGSTVETLDFASVVDRGPTVPPFDYGAVAVIDGKKLKLTPLRQAGVPPPMAFVEIEADENIIACAFSRTCQRLAYITGQCLYLATWEMQQPSASAVSPPLRLSTNVRIRKVDLPVEKSQDFIYTQIAIQDDDKVFILAPPRDNSQLLPARCKKLTWVTTIRPNTGAVFQDIDIDASAQNLLTDVSLEITWIQSSGSTLPLLTHGNENKLTGDQPQSSIYQSALGSYHKVSLQLNGVLLADQQILARDCKSFVLTSTHLIFTTTQHLLKVAHLAEPENIGIPGNTPEVDERCRAVERGSKIVTVSPSIYAVTLQMPRGNLETIFPRVLVLTGIRRHVRNLEYRSAFLASQNHQVDLNILYDYQPALFLTNVEKFVDQLKKASRVDEFISKLKEEDVTQTLYRDTLAEAAQDDEPTLESSSVNGISQKPRPVGGKVNHICDALVSNLKSRSSSYLQNIITAHVCKRPPDLVAALTLVSSLRNTSQEEADLAISHLCFLTDTNRLFDAALALYDLELALLVAQNAQRDPKEYMPFLQNLQALPTLRRQHTIDNHLRNYAKALVSLHGLEAHGEVEAYTVKHNLYNTAFTLYQHSPSHNAKITRLYAEYLTNSKSQHAAAATLYESLSDYDSAYPLYALTHQWREALTCASLAGMSFDKIQSLASSLATTLADENRDYRAAATIYADYLNDVLSAARLLCKGSYFAEAQRLLSHPKRQISSETLSASITETIPTIIDPALTEKFGEIIELIADCKLQLAAQVPRVEDLRRKKLEDPLAFYGGDPASSSLEHDIPDNVSLAATDASTQGGQSLFTRYGGSQSSRFAGTVASNVSRKTSKTKRREERKRARGKKGSVYEEEYLVGSVGRLISRVNGVHDEVERLVSGLMRRGLREQASKVEEVMREIGTLCEDAKGRVWPDSTPAAAAGEDGNTLSVRPPGADGVFYDSQMETESGGQGAKKEAPEVKIWKGGPLSFD